MAVYDEYNIQLVRLCCYQTEVANVRENLQEQRYLSGYMADRNEKLVLS